MESLELAKFKVLENLLYRNAFSASYITTWIKLLVSYKCTCTRRALPPSPFPSPLAISLPLHHCRYTTRLGKVLFEKPINTYILRFRSNPINKPVKWYNSNEIHCEPCFKIVNRNSTMIRYNFFGC